MPLTLDGTNGEVFPSWTTATRPASPTAGQTGFNTTTGQLETYNGSGWRISSGAATQGTSGQYLQSAGAGAAPTWATLSASGGLIRAPQILTSGTSYTTPSNCTAIYVEAVGGGGGGGNYGNVISGAGGGGYCAKYFTVTGSTSYTYAIGAGGASKSASSADGNAGGNTTFTVGATTITAGGGGGGSGNGSSAPSAAAGGAGGTATNGDINIVGGAGGYGQNGNATGSEFNTAGGGGSTILGIGPPAVLKGGGSSPNNVRVNGNNYGTGGLSNANSVASGNGASGVIRIWEYT